MAPTLNASAPKRARKPKLIPAELPKTGLVRSWVVEVFFPVSDEQRRRQIAAGMFPKPVKIGKRAIAWRAEDLHAYVASLEAA